MVDFVTDRVHPLVSLGNRIRRWPYSQTPNQRVAGSTFDIPDGDFQHSLAHKSLQPDVLKHNLFVPCWVAAAFGHAGFVLGRLATIGKQAALDKGVDRRVPILGIAEVSGAIYFDVEGTNGIWLL